MGRDAPDFFSARYCINFNPLSRVGRDRLHSLHNKVPFLFQSTLPRGERQNVRVYCQEQGLFQSTLPRGERRRLPKPCHIFPNFNPLSRVGRDAVHRCYRFLQKKFQSTLPRGERHL